MTISPTQMRMMKTTAAVLDALRPCWLRVADFSLSVSRDDVTTVGGVGFGGSLTVVQFTVKIYRIVEVCTIQENIRTRKFADVTASTKMQNKA